ncbi:Lipase, GDSL [Cynara cardunculus var. scolymus]|uniref:Lipase, GDSL n=1 Tax=Cynara cardunculus var. scolymus TaxID=59895 RepID=A0A118JS54_CYNCS|nr:Lipase, GDSL [Cynara cardunculus var. scolymus]
MIEMGRQRWWFTVVVVVAWWWEGVIGAGQAPAIWVMGDSLVDSGNNNFMRSIARADYFPYGCDYYRGASGRFCNARTFSDILGDWLGIPAPPPFSDPGTAGNRLLGGVNYASASGGILDESGQHYQVVNFETTLGQLRTMLSPEDLTQLLSNSIVVMVFGSNDYLNNYLMPTVYTSSRTYTPEAFATLLLNHYARQIHALYSLGLRKFFLPGLGPLGCIPNQLATGQAAPGRCVDSVNQLIGPFNEGLKNLVDQFNGFTVRDRACCGIGRNQGQITCLPMTTPCFNRDQYVFWDAFHPTQAANAVLAQRAYSGSTNDCSPINVQQLAQIKF